MSNNHINNSIFCVRKKNIYVVLCLIYKGIMDWSYYILSNSAFKMEFKLEINIIKCIVSYALIFILSYELSKTSKISGFFLKFLHYVCVIPMSSVFCMRNESIVFFFSTYLCFFFVVIFTKKYVIKFGKHVILDSKESADIFVNFNQDKNLTIIAKIFNSVSFICGLLVVAIMYRYNGIPSFAAFTFTNVYEIRSQFVTNPYLNYLIAILSGVLVPVEIALGLELKRYFGVLFYGLVQIFLFLWTGNKIYLFSLLLIFVVHILIKLNVSINTLFGGLAAVGLIGNFSSIVSNSLFDSVFSFFNRRMMLDSATLKFFYYDYFIIKGNPRTWFAGTILAPIFPVGNSENFRYTIAELYTGYPSSANTGLFGGDIACVGLGAAIIVPFLLILLVILIENTYKIFGASFTLAMYIYIVYRLNEICIYSFFMDFSGVVLVLFVLFYRKRGGESF